MTGKAEIVQDSSAPVRRLAVVGLFVSLVLGAMGAVVCLFLLASIEDSRGITDLFFSALILAGLFLLCYYWAALSYHLRCLAQSAEAWAALSPGQRRLTYIVAFPLFLLPIVLATLGFLLVAVLRGSGGAFFESDAGRSRRPDLLRGEYVGDDRVHHSGDEATHVGDEQVTYGADGKPAYIGDEQVLYGADGKAAFVGDDQVHYGAGDKPTHIGERKIYP